MFKYFSDFHILNMQLIYVWKQFSETFFRKKAHIVYWSTILEIGPKKSLNSRGLHASFRRIGTLNQRKRPRRSRQEEKRNKKTELPRGSETTNCELSGRTSQDTIMGKVCGSDGGKEGCQRHVDALKSCCFLFKITVSTWLMSTIMRNKRGWRKIKIQHFHSKQFE